VLNHSDPGAQDHGETNQEGASLSQGTDAPMASTVLDVAGVTEVVVKEPTEVEEADEVVEQLGNKLIVKWRSGKAHTEETLAAIFGDVGQIESMHVKAGKGYVHSEHSLHRQFIRSIHCIDQQRYYHQHHHRRRRRRHQCSDFVLTCIAGPSLVL
jgi:hypothetical protein